MGHVPSARDIQVTGTMTESSGIAPLHRASRRRAGPKFRRTTLSGPPSHLSPLRENTLENAVRAGLMLVGVSRLLAVSRAVTDCNTSKLLANKPFQG